jgi:type IV secretion system protein VirD4
MVSRQETARPLLTPGEVMQLAQSDELVLVSGLPPVRAQKVRYYEDRRLASRVLPPPELTAVTTATDSGAPKRADDWTALPIINPRSEAAGPPIAPAVSDDDPANGGIRREPALPEHEAIAHELPKPSPEFPPFDEEPDDEAVRVKAMNQSVRTIARQVVLDPDDGLGL